MKEKNLLKQDGELYLFSNFISNEVSNHYYQQLLEIVPWEQREITMFGKTVYQPRLISWHAAPTINYSYSGIDLVPSPWNQPLLEIKQIIEKNINEPFNSAFLNLYRDGKDYMGWHRDNEKSLGPQPLIASVSLGATRKLKFKHISQTDLVLNIELTSGSLLVMRGEIQHYWKHALPKMLRVNAPRINITFRQVN